MHTRHKKMWVLLCNFSGSFKKGVQKYKNVQEKKKKVNFKEKEAPKSPSKGIIPFKKL